MKSLRIVLLVWLIVLAATSTFNIQVTSTCTNYTGVTCTAWSQTGSIIEETAACLPGNALVMTDRGLLNMNQLKVGDRVLSYNRSTGKDEYSSVEAWLHRYPNQQRKYVRLQTADLQLTISEKHNIATSRSYAFTFAKQAIGKELVSNLTNQTVEKVIETTQSGLFSPLTLNNNFYVVAGKGLVLVHCYSHIAFPQYYETYFTPLVRLYQHFFWYTESENEWIHPVARFSKYILESFTDLIEL